MEIYMIREKISKNILNDYWWQYNKEGFVETWLSPSHNSLKIFSISEAPDTRLSGSIWKTMRDYLTGWVISLLLDEVNPLSTLRVRPGVNFDRYADYVIEELRRLTNNNLYSLFKGNLPHSFNNSSRMHRNNLLDNEKNILRCILVDSIEVLKIEILTSNYFNPIDIIPFCTKKMQKIYKEYVAMGKKI